MHTYSILKNHYQIGIAKGKHKAFEFINSLLKGKDELGVWFGLKCVTDNDIYEIERVIE